MTWEIIIAQVLVVLVNNMAIIVTLSIITLIILGIFSVRWYTRDTYIVRVKKGTIMDFKSAVLSPQNKVKVHLFARFASATNSADILLVRPILLFTFSSKFFVEALSGGAVKG